MYQSPLLKLKPCISILFCASLLIVSPLALRAGGFCSGLANLTVCVDTFDDGSGASNYSDDTDCQWLIQPPGAAAIALNFLSFDVEDGFDSVCVYDGTSEADPLITCFTGNTLPPSVLSSGGSMLVVFRSDESETGQGWSATYNCQSSSFCAENSLLTSCDDGLTDGSGALNYHNSTSCQWLIQPAGATSITLSFTSFDTEVIYDELCIYDGPDDSAPSLGCFSGDSLPPDLTSSGGSMFLVFNADETVTGAGWAATYACQTGAYCNGLATLTSCSGILDDGSGSNDYTNNANCQWLIQPSNASSVTLNFTSFQTESDYDEVCVYDGSNDSSPLLGCFSGDSIPPSIVSSGGSMFVAFTSDISITAAGWSATYDCTTGQYCNGLATLTACSGSFDDGSGANNYLDYANCQWLIQPPGASSIYLTFSAFETEEFFDEVCIYDGATLLSPLLGCYSGDTIPLPLVSTGGSMLVTFTSDSSITEQGWSVSYDGCAPELSVSGFIRTELNSNVPGAVITMTGTNTGNDTTSLIGQYNLNVALNDIITITPTKNNDITTNNGITTLDIILIQRQVLVVQPLNSPYKIIAGDVNASNGVTTLDIVMIRAVILQSATTFPGGQLWRFVPSDFVFSNPQNPFPFDNFRTYNNISESQANQNFIGIKLGDVNNSWDPNTPKMAAVGDVHFQIGEHRALPGSEINIPVTVIDFNNVLGYQFTLSWNPQVLMLLETQNQSLNGHFGETRTAEGLLATSWNSETANAFSLADGDTAFELKFEVLGTLGEYSPITIVSEMAVSEAYNENIELLSVEGGNGIVKVEGASSNSAFISGSKNLKVYPNPFSNKTQISFFVSNNQTASIVIYDVLGKEVWRNTSYFTAGGHKVEWSGNDKSGNQIPDGLYHIVMQLGNDSRCVKALLTR